MPSPLDISVSQIVAAPAERVRSLMFDPRQDPRWMAAVKTVEPLAAEFVPGTRVRRTGRFLGRTLHWTTEVTAVSAHHLDLRIVDGPMRGTVEYRVEPDHTLLTFMMRRSLTADLQRLKQAVEGTT